LTQEVLKHFSGVVSPRVINVRVNAGFIPADHWIQDPEVGGGRLIGEACHFVDLACALAQSDPVEVHTVATAKPNVPALINDNAVISPRFANGSVASIVYTADGAKAQSKERVEVFGGGRGAVIDDFRTGELFEGDTGSRKIGGGAQDKGQSAMLSGWVEGIKSGRTQTPAATTLAVSAATIAAVESLTVGMPVGVGKGMLA
jgi:polar amino acid transport system substrate-binding protein